MVMQQEALKAKMIEMSGKSKVFDKIGRYIMEQDQQILFMTAEQVARQADASQGSVTRFCNELGFAGYSDFIRYLQSSRMQDVNPTAPERLRFMENLDEGTVRIISSEHNNLDRLYQVVQTKEYHEMVRAIAGAEKIILLSARISETLLEYIGYILNKIRDDVMLVRAESSRWNTLPLNDPKGTLILTVVFPRYPNILIQKLRELKQSGFSIMAFTDSLLSPVLPLTDNSIIVPLTKASIFDVYSTPLLLFNILLKDVAAEIPNLEIRLRRMEKMDIGNQVYYQAGRKNDYESGRNLADESD